MSVTKTVHIIRSVDTSTCKDVNNIGYHQQIITITAYCQHNNNNWSAVSWWWLIWWQLKKLQVSWWWLWLIWLAVRWLWMIWWQLIQLQASCWRRWWLWLIWVAATWWWLIWLAVWQLRLTICNLQLDSLLTAMLWADWPRQYYIKCGQSLKILVSCLPFWTRHPIGQQWLRSLACSNNIIMIQFQFSIGPHQNTLISCV